MKTLSQAELDALRRITTPTVSNAVELFDVRPRNEGFMSPDVGCLFPDLGVMVGYAVTARFAADQPPARAASRYDFWKFVQEIPEPRVMVLQDLDQPCGVGAFFGEVQSTVHRRLGCVGVVTNGHVRDLEEVHALGFHYFAAGVCVSHANVHLVDFGGPVKVGGLVVRPGDLMHGDRHGVLKIPLEVAHKVVEAADEVARKELRILEHCKSPDFSLEELKRLYEA